AVAAAPTAHAGAAAGVVNTARVGGATLGVAVLGGLFAAHAGPRPIDPQGVVDGLHSAFVGGAISEGFCAIVAWGVGPGQCPAAYCLHPILRGALGLAMRTNAQAAGTVPGQIIKS